MEKDYFKDRPESVTKHICVPPGTKVFICEKQMQKHAKELKDLTLIEVTDNLTSNSIHPRGQKVRGTCKRTDCFGNEITAIEGNFENVVGRCTYIVNDDYTVETKEGTKFLSMNLDGHFKLLTKKEVEGKYKISCNLMLQNSLTINVPIFRFMYFDTKEDCIQMLKTITIEEPVLHFGFVTMFLNKIEISVIGTHEGIFIDDNTFLKKLSNCFPSDEQTEYEFNKRYSLSLKNFEIKRVSFA